MSSDRIDASTSRIVRYEVLAGLPGEGPVPKYFHLGHPTPWAEGVVVRFWNLDGTEWVGNFQNSRIGGSEIVQWPEANAIIIKTPGPLTFDLYIIDIMGSDAYSFHLYATGLLFNEDRSLLFVSERIRIFAYGRYRRLIWIRDGLGGYDARLKNCSDGVLTVDVEEEMGEARQTIRLSSQDGRTL